MDNGEAEDDVPAGRRFPWWQAAAVLAVAGAVGTWLGSQGAGDAPAPAAPVEKSAPVADPEVAAAPAPPPPGDPAAATYAGGEADTTMAAAAPTPPPTAAAEPMPGPATPAPPPVVAAAVETKPDVVFKPEDASIFDMDEKPSGARPPATRPAVTPPDRPDATAPETPRPSRELSTLERQYVTALEREAARAGVGDRSAWEAEAAAVRSGEDLDGEVASLPAGLQKMRRIFLEQRAAETGATATGQPPAAGPSAAARSIELFVLADDTVRVYLNGNEQKGEYLVGREDTPGAIVRLGLTVEPGDVLGFHVRNYGGAAYFACSALAGVQRLFGSSARWESVADRPDAAWLKGDGTAGAPSRELRPNVDYALGVAKLFEQRSNCGSTAYRVIWPGGSEAGFRYRLRAADLPQKPNLPGR